MFPFILVLIFTSYFNIKFKIIFRTLPQTQVCHSTNYVISNSPHNLKIQSEHIQTQQLPNEKHSHINHYQFSSITECKQYYLIIYFTSENNNSHHEFKMCIVKVLYKNVVYG